MVCFPPFICQAEALKHGSGLGFPEGFPWLRGLTRPVKWEWVAKGCRAQNPPACSCKCPPPPHTVKEQVSPHWRFQTTNKFYFSYRIEQVSLFFCKRHQERGKGSVSCMVASWFWKLSKLQTQVCSLLLWRGFQPVCRNYQVMGLWDGEEHCRKKNKTKQNKSLHMVPGEGMEEETRIIRDKIIVWTSVKAPSRYYIDEGHHPHHLLFQKLFKSKMSQGAFCEHWDCISVRCALTVSLGEGCTGNLVCCIFYLHLVSLYGWAPYTWSRSRLARSQNSEFFRMVSIEKRMFSSVESMTTEFR